MSSALLASKTVILEEEPQIRNVPGVPTAVLGAVGVTARGPVGLEVLCTSFTDYVNVFGGYTANGFLPNVVEGFFAEGGQEVHVVRTVHYTDATNPASKTSAAATLVLATSNNAASSGVVTSAIAGPYDLEPGQHVDVKIDGAGSATVVTFTATSAARESAAGTFNLADAQTLALILDGSGTTQTVTFHTSNFVSITAATATEVAAVINAGIVGGRATVTNTTHVSITSDRRGSSSGVNVTGGSANTALGYATGNVSGTGNVANIDAVTTTEALTAINGAVAGQSTTNVAGAVRITSSTTGASSSVQVVNTTTALAFGFDNATHVGLATGTQNTLRIDGKTDGTYANVVTVRVDAPTSGDAGRFNLVVLLSGLIVELFPDLSMVATDVRYVETVVNDAGTGSKLIAATDLEIATPSPNDSPAPGLFGPMTGGSDGLAGLADVDFVGTDPGKTGMRALDLVSNLSLLIVPDRATAAVQDAMINYCENVRAMAVFAILDPPAGLTATGVITYAQSTAALLGLSEFGALYWPRITVLNPSTAVFGNAANITIPPSGNIAGVYARTDAASEGGVYKPPAGVANGKLAAITGFETKEVLDESRRDLVFPKRINPISTEDGASRFLDGARTLKGTGNFPTVAERRGAIFIEQSVKKALLYARHQNNDEALRASVARTVDGFLLAQMNNGAFRSRDPKTAYFVDFGEGLNTPAVQFAGQLIGRIGIATQKPAEFIVLRFSQDTRAFDIANS